MTGPDDCTTARAVRARTHDRKRWGDAHDIPQAVTHAAERAVSDPSPLTGCFSRKSVALPVWPSSSNSTSPWPWYSPVGALAGHTRWAPYRLSCRRPRTDEWPEIVVGTGAGAINHYGAGRQRGGSLTGLPSVRLGRSVESRQPLESAAVRRRSATGTDCDAVDETRAQNGTPCRPTANRSILWEETK